MKVCLLKHLSPQSRNCWFFLLVDIFHVGFPSWLYFLSFLMRTCHRSGLRAPSGVRILHVFCFLLIQRKKLAWLEPLLAVIYHNIIFWVFNSSEVWGCQVYNPAVFLYSTIQKGVWSLNFSAFQRPLSSFPHFFEKTPMPKLLLLINILINILSQISLNTIFP